MPSSTSVIAAIEHYKRKLDKYAHDETIVLHCIDKLDRLTGVSISVLQTTGIGRTVNALKKNHEGPVADRAKELVQKWKDIVANEEKEEEQAEDDSQEEKEPEPVSEPEPDPEPKPDPEPEPEPEPEAPPREEKRSSNSSGSHHHKHKHSSKKSKRKRESDDHEAEDHDQHRSKGKKHKKDRDREKERSSRDKERRVAAASDASQHHHKSSKAVHDTLEQKRSTKKAKHQQLCNQSDAFDIALNGLEAFSEKETQKNKERMERLEQKRQTPTTSSASSGNSNSGYATLSSLSSVPSGLSTTYRPLPRKPESPAISNGRALVSEDEALSALIARSKSKGSRTAVYSGIKRTGYFGDIPSLKNMCIHLLQEFVDSIEQCGNLPYDVLEPVLERAQPNSLLRIEEFNPHLIEDTGPLWERFCKRHFPKAKREELESYREMFERCTKEREEKLDRLKIKVKDSYKREENSHKKAKLAYVGAVAKPPRNVFKAQAKNGTALPIGKSFGGVSNPLRPNPAPVPTTSSASKKPKKAPMMAKTLKMIKGMKAGFRR